VIKLSILLPVFNEAEHIKECLNSILENNIKDFEVVVSDNCSSDNTLEILSKFNDKRLKVFVTDQQVSPYKNFKNAFNNSSGEYIFFMGGDDLLTKGIIDTIYPLLDGGATIFGKLLCFYDGEETYFEASNTKEYLNSIFKGTKDFTPSYLLNLRDEIMYSFIKKDYFYYSRYLVDNSLERLLTWQALVIFNLADVQRFKFTNEIFIRKRYYRNKRISGYAHDSYHKLLGASYTLKAFNSLYNSFVTLLVTRKVKVFFSLFFTNRIVQSSGFGGFFGQFPSSKKYYFYFSPTIMIFLAPIIDLLRFFRNLFIQKR